MSEYTPETLRDRLKEFPIGGPLWRGEEALAELRAHAAAWEADRKQSDEYARLWHRDAKELASLRAAIRQVVEHFDALEDMRENGEGRDAALHSQEFREHTLPELRMLAALAQEKDGPCSHK